MLELTVGLMLAASGTYLVPTPERLEKFARNPISGASWAVENGQLRLSYTLPPELGGHGAYPVELKGPHQGESFIAVSGAAGSGQCTVGKTLVCLVMYPKLRVEKNRVEDYLKKKYSGAELEGRLEVFELFANEPRGLVTLER